MFTVQAAGSSTTQSIFLVLTYSLVQKIKLFHENRKSGQLILKLSHAKVGVCVCRWLCVLFSYWSRRGLEFLYLHADLVLQMKDSGL